MNERDMIDLNEFESEIYVVFFKEFGGNSRVNLKVNFVKFCVRFD